MKLLIKFTAVICILACVPNSFGQKNLNNNREVFVEPSSKNTSDKKTYQKNLQEELKGTYQFQIKKETYAPLVTVSTLEIIKSSRLEDEDVVISLDQYIDIFIPSKKRVESSDFKLLVQSKYIVK